MVLGQKDIGGLDIHLPAAPSKEIKPSIFSLYPHHVKFEIDRTILTFIINE